MKQQKIYLSILFFCNSFFVTAQVNLQTGAATYSMPIFSYSDQSRLSTAISLDYFNGSGLQVNEIAGAVGTGWNLQAGGVITRVQRGLPDDQRRLTTTPNPVPQSLLMTSKQYRDTYFPNGYLFSVFTPQDNLTNIASMNKMLPSGYYINPAYGQPVNYRPAPVSEFVAADREQDIFELNYGKGVVEFVINKDLQVVTLNESRIKVDVVFENMLGLRIKTCISKFIVTDESGIQYIFSSRELSEECLYDNKRELKNPYGQDKIDLNENFISYNLTEGTWGNIPSTLIGAPYLPGQTPINNTYRFPVSIPRKTGNFIVTKWYLSKILNPMVSPQDKIDFVYEDYQINMIAGRSFYNLSSTGGAVVTKEFVSALRIKTIFCKNASVEFIYDNITRIDVPDIKPLKEIIIKKQNSLVNKFVFDYQYFLANLTKPYNYQFAEKEKFMIRLSLKSIQKIGNDGQSKEPATVFDYYLGDPNIVYSLNSINEPFYWGTRDIVPPMYSRFYDHWGYYRANPGGFGLDDKEFPVNYFYYPGENCQNGCVHRNAVSGGAKNGIIKSITNPLGGKLSFEYEQNQAFFNGQNIDNGGVRVKKINQYDGISHLNDLETEYKYVKSDGVTSTGWGYEIPIYRYAKIMRVYIQSRESGYTLGNPNITMASSVITSALTQLISNSLSKAISNFVQSFKMLMLTIVVQVIIDAFTPTPPEFTEELKTEIQSFPFNSKNPLPALYSRVEVLQKNNGLAANGKIVYDFTSDVDYSLYTPVIEFPFSNKPRYNTTCFGLPKKISILDNTGFVLKETYNEYELRADIAGVSMDWLTKKEVFDKYTLFTRSYYNELGTFNITQNTYYNLHHFTYLKSSTDRTFSKNNSGFIDNRVDYNYDLYSHQVTTKKITDSRGRVIETKTYYPKDYNLSALPILQAMVNKNIINVPIATETWQTNASGTIEMLSASVAEFGVAANGDYMPIKNYRLQTDKPVPINVIGAFNPSVLVRNSNLIKPETEITYSNTGNMVELKDIEAAKKNCTIYSNNVVNFSSNTTEYPIATITNAALSEVAYSSFEYDPPAGASNGIFLDNNWTITSANWTDELSPTGKRNIELNSTTTISANVSVTKDYKLTLWATSNSFSVNSFAPTIIGPTINGWTYYEYNIPSGAVSPIITGSCKIDELRLYPKSSNITTITYDAGIGKTSECDINNRIVYYEYDALGRLVKVRDESRNIIKTYEYNFKN